MCDRHRASDLYDKARVSWRILAASTQLVYAKTLLKRPLESAMNSMLAHRKNCPTLSTAAPSTQASPRRQIGGRRASIGTECLSSGRAWAEAPRWGGRAKIENSSRRHPRKFGQKRFLVVRRSWRKNGVACFGLPPWKKFSAA